MNSPALLIGCTGTSATAAQLPTDEPSAEDGFSSALASSIAGQANEAASSAKENVAPAAPADEAPSLADLAQWLGLPVAAAAPVPAGAESQADSGDALPADTDALMPQQQVLAAATARVAGSRGTVVEADSSTSTPKTDAEADALLPLLAASEQTPAAAPAPAPTSSSSILSSSPTAPAPLPPVTLATALVRDGATSLPAAAPTVRASLHETVGSARWADELGSRLVMMSVRGQQEGSLTLMPEHLGPLEVQISVSKDTANVWFGAQHADTRAALTEALPRLRELLAGSGLSLGQSGVSEQTPRRSPDGEPSRLSGGGTMLDTSVTEVTTPGWRAMRSGLIDTYA